MHHRLLTAARTASLLLALGGGTAGAQPWELVWEDNFDGFELDTTKWEPMIGDGSNYGIPGWGNNEWQYYTARTDNVRVVAGVLQITARRENFGGMQYTSARLRTLNKGDFLYGRIEARMIVPSATGIWPAFWMLPTGSPYGGWASSGEIDIMESTNAADRIHGTLHFGGSWPNNTSSGGSTTMGGTNFSAGYHEYAIEWEPDEIRWYIDDVLYLTRTSSTWFSSSGAAAGNLRAPFDTPFHLLLNVAVGGNWPGSPNAADYPQTMTVDYVRVYSAGQAAYDGEPHAVPGLIEAEDFDEGMQGQAYNDCDPANQGGAYRDTGVDIEASTENGFNIGWMCNGEWLEYTIDVQETGTYRIDTRVASQITGGVFRYEIDGQPITPDVVFPATGGWQNWQTFSTIAELTAGEHVLRFANRSSGHSYNFNWFEFTLESEPCPADIDGNGMVNLDDLDAFVTAFLSSEAAADMDGNGTINLDDLDAFIAAFTAGCE